MSARSSHSSRPMRWLLSLAGLLMVVAACGDAAAVRVDGAEALALARTQRTADAYVEAERVLRAELAASPDDLDAQVALAVAVSSRHGFDESIELASGVLSSDPSRADALAVRGDAQLALGNYAEAAADHRRLHELSPGPASLVRLAHGLEISGDPWTALTLVERALAEVEAAELRTGDPVVGEAAAWYRWRVGDLRRHLGDPAGAEPHFRAALSIQPHYALAYEGLIDVALSEGRIDDARARLAEWPTGSTLRLEAAIAVAETVGDSEAVRRLQRQLISSLEAEPTEVAGLDLAAALLAEGVELERALGLTTAEVGRRRDSGTLLLHAEALHRTGDSVDALAYVEEALRSGTNEPSELAIAAVVLHAVGEDERADIQLSRAREITHPSPERLRTLNN